jgi:hypothetical protein
MPQPPPPQHMLGNSPGSAMPVSPQQQQQHQQMLRNKAINGPVYQNPGPLMDPSYPMSQQPSPALKLPLMNSQHQHQQPYPPPQHSPAGMMMPMMMTKPTSMQMQQMQQPLSVQTVPQQYHQQQQHQPMPPYPQFSPGGGGTAMKTSPQPNPHMKPTVYHLNQQQTNGQFMNNTNMYAEMASPGSMLNGSAPPSNFYKNSPVQQQQVAASPSPNLMMIKNNSMLDGEDFNGDDPYELKSSRKSGSKHRPRNGMQPENFLMQQQPSQYGNSNSNNLLMPGNAYPATQQQQMQQNQYQFSNGTGQFGEFVGGEMSENPTVATPALDDLLMEPIYDDPNFALGGLQPQQPQVYSNQHQSQMAYNNNNMIMSNNQQYQNQQMRFYGNGPQLQQQQQYQPTSNGLYSTNSNEIGNSSAGASLLESLLLD